MSEINEIRGRSNSYLTFILDNEKFATHVAHVNIILEIPKITKVPRTPVFMKGVINHRGMVLPVFDLRLKMSMPEKEYTSDTCILVLEIETENEKVNVGAIVDSVKEVLEIKAENIQPPPTIGNYDQTKYIYGIAKIGEEFVMMLDMNIIFNTNETIELTKHIQQFEAESKKEEKKQIAENKNEGKKDNNQEVEVKKPDKKEEKQVVVNKIENKKVKKTVTDKKKTLKVENEKLKV